MRKRERRYLVECDLDILETEVVEGKHANIDQGEGENLTGDVLVRLKGRNQREEWHAKRERERVRLFAFVKVKIATPTSFRGDHTRQGGARPQPVGTRSRTAGKETCTRTSWQDKKKRKTLRKKSKQERRKKLRQRGKRSYLKIYLLRKTTDRDTTQ